MKNIPLSDGEIAIVDDEDFPVVSRLAWTHVKRGSEKRGLVLDYAQTSFSGEGRGSKGVRVYLHRLLANTIGKNGYLVMHKNKNGLDCRKENLILVPYHTILNKARKRPLHKGKKTTSKYKGVWLHRDNRTGNTRWQVAIKKDGFLHYLGRFTNEFEAARAYNKKAKELYGDLAYQNDV